MSTITTVKDLIAELSTKDPGAPVLFATERDGAYEECLIGWVESLTHSGGGRVLLHDGGWE